MLLASIGVFIGIALLPGSLDGVYRGMAPECGCDSVNFIYCTNGRLVLYKSEHPPADFVGKYEMGRDGVCSLYLFSTWAGKNDELWYRAYPHFLVTRFAETKSGEWSQWCWKWPKIGVIGKTMKEHEIVRQVIVGKGRVATTRFDRNFQKIGEETITKQDPKSAGPPAGNNVNSSDTPSMNQEFHLSTTTRYSIASELAWLQQSGHTVIMEEPASKKFVQFGWKTLMVDLPSQTLSKDEMDRAGRIMARFDIPKRVYPIGTPEDRVLQTSFQKHLGGDIKFAVRVVEAVFREVYLFPEDIHLEFKRVE